MARASIEPPEQTWGTLRMLTVMLEHLGYRVDRIVWADGTSTLRLS
jgi:hypothetical protein